MYGFIYITTNLVNGKKYLGQRKYGRGWEDYLGSGVFLGKDIKKFGKDNFKRDIIIEAETREQLNEFEVEYISKYGCVKSNEWYNIHFGGKGGALPGDMCHNYGRKETETQRKNISEGMRKYIEENGTDKWKRPLTEQAKRKLGKPFSVIDIKTNKLINFYTKPECAKFLGVSIHSVKYHLYYEKILNGRYKFQK